MKTTLLSIFTALVCALVASPGFSQDVEKGDRLELLVNLHPDMARRTLYSTNYQLAGLMPMCSEVTVKKIKRKKMVFEWKGLDYTFVYDKHAKGAGVSFEAVLGEFFGAKCDKDKVSKMSKVDQKGIKRGVALKGMTRQGVLYAMGRPPYHANPDLEAYTWMYWQNRFVRKAIEFDDNGIVSSAGR